MLVLKILINEWQNVSRDKRELSVCNELGMQTMVMAKGNPSDSFVKVYSEGFEVIKCSTRPLGSSVPVGLNRLISIFKWAAYARKLQPEIISGHDISGVFIGWLSNKGRRKKSKLVYDSHEFEPGRNVKRSKLMQKAVMALEKFLIKKCEFTIIPCDSAADELVKIYNLNKRPVVVRSTPNLTLINENKKNIIRDRFKSYFPNSVSYIIMYHGGIMPNRGIEQILEAIESLLDIGFVILGNALVASYMEEIKALVKLKKIEDRVLFHSAVPHDVLIDYVAAADLGMVVIIPKTKSYFFALPNKFFENIQAITPVIASDIPELHRLVNKFDIGILCDSQKPEEIAKAITKMQINVECYEKYKKNMKIAKNELNWDVEKKRLIDAYRKISKG